MRFLLLRETSKNNEGALDESNFKPFDDKIILFDFFKNNTILNEAL